MLRMHSGEQEGAKELITVTTVETASQSGTFLLSWIHFQANGLGHLALKSPHLLRLEIIMEEHMRTFNVFFFKEITVITLQQLW